jgi:hypothetical protein
METSQRFRQTQIDQERTEGSQGSGNVQFDISALYIPEGEDAPKRTLR